MGESENLKQIHRELQPCEQECPRRRQHTSRAAHHAEFAWTPMADTDSFLSLGFCKRVRYLRSGNIAV